MIRLVLSLCVALSLTVCLVHGQTDYCDVSLCGSAVHIACNNTGAWSPNCPTSPAPELVEMDAGLQEVIVRSHNGKRNILANELLRYRLYEYWPPARKMASMRWSPEMASLTALTVRQCELKRDACRNTKEFKHSGQNVGEIIYTDDSLTTTDLVNSVINRWWTENVDANVSIVGSFKSRTSPPSIDNFALMARQPNNYVGCTGVKYVRSGSKVFSLVCNYATDLVTGEPLYVKGRTASGCIKGSNTGNLGLCAFSEPYP